MSAAQLFPMFLKLEGRLCLIVGANEELEGKIRGLLAAGAKVLVVATKPNEGIAALASSGNISWSLRKFQPEDLEGVTLVVAADEDQAINDLVFSECSLQGIPCNVVDQPERCHFYYPAVVRRGALQVAISTAGRSPALASTIRAELEQHFPAEYADWVEVLGTTREHIPATQQKSSQRTRLLQKIASRQRFEQFRRKRQAGNKGGQ